MKKIILKKSNGETTLVELDSFAKTQEFFKELQYNENVSELLLGYEHVGDGWSNAYRFIVLSVENERSLKKLDVFHYIFGEYRGTKLLILPILEELSDVQLEPVTRAVEEYLSFEEQRISEFLGNQLIIEDLDLTKFEYHFGNVEFSLNQTSKIRSCELGGGLLPVPSKHAFNVMRDHFDNHVIFAKNKIYTYNSSAGIWHSHSVPSMETYVFNNYFKCDVLDNVFKLTIVSLKRITYRDNFPCYSGSSHNVIVMQNCALIPATGEVFKYHPYYYSVIKLSYSYDKQAKCELWLKTLNYFFEFDADRLDKIDLLQEAMGLSLTNISSFQKMFLLLGDGCNGKSLVANLLTQLIGVENVSTVNLVNFHEKFSLSKMHNKLVNIDPDLERNSMKAEGKFKSIISGESFNVEEKYQATFSMEPQLKLWACGNELPKSKSKSFGYYRRFLILQFSRIIDEKDRDPELLQKLLHERSGILNWALEGLKRLLDKNSFTIPISSEEVLKKYQYEDNPVKRFVEEKLNLLEDDDKHARIDRSEVYTKFCNFLVEEAYCTDKIKRAEFYQQMDKLGVKSGKSGFRYFSVQYREEK